MKPLAQPIRAHLIIEPGRLGDFPGQIADIALCRVPSAQCEEPEPEVLNYYATYAEALRAGAWEAETRHLPLIIDPVCLLAMADALGPEKPTIVIYHDGGAFYDVSGNIAADVIFLDSDLEGCPAAEIVDLDNEERLRPSIWSVELSDELTANAREMMQVRAKQEERIELEKAGAIDDDEVTE